MMNESATLQMQEWLARMRAGDAQARDELLRGVGRRLEGLARRMLRNYPVVRRWAQTDDVLQNALVRLLRALEAVQPATPRDFFNLAAVQIRRELTDLARHFSGPKGLGANIDSGARGEQEEDAPSPALDDDLEMWQHFHQAVDSLPTEEREVVSLLFYHGWQQQEVAELFDVHPRTIRRWWQSALVRLHPILKDFKLD